MQQIKATNKQRQQQGLAVFDIGIGVHGGDVVVGNIGSEFRMDLACVGDAVNLSSRLCSAAKGGEILISDELYEHSSKTFTAKNATAISVKGKESKIKIKKIV